MEHSEISCCPFCGTEGVAHFAGSIWNKASGDYFLPLWAVQCQNFDCKIHGPFAHTRKAAIQKWNLRYSVKAKKAPLDPIEQIIGPNSEG